MKSPLLSIQDVQVWFPIKRGIISRTRGFIRAVDGVSLELHKGETLGIVGESGCGKTTLARAIMQLDPIRKGSILFEGNDILTENNPSHAGLAQHVQMIFQDPYSSLNPRMTIMDIITEGMVEHTHITSKQRAETARRLLQEVGIRDDALYRYPHEFSGGQRQRISVARALSLKPEIIICDEAVSALDVSVQAQVINLLADLREKHGLSYLFISHDLSVIRHISDRIVVMYLGRIVESGPCAQIIESPIHPYTRALISAVPIVGSDQHDSPPLVGDVPSPANPPTGCHFHPRCPYATDVCKLTYPTLESFRTNKHLVACHMKNDL